MTKRKYYLIHVNLEGIANKKEIGYERSDYLFWIKHKKTIKNDSPKSIVRINRNKKDPWLVDGVLILYPDGTKDYIVAHTKYKKMIEENKFKFK